MATGYSQQAAARATGLAVQTINSWINDLSFSARFRELISERAEEYQRAKDAVHDQQVVMALQVIQEALSGEMQRERVGDAAVKPLRYEAAVELLRSTFWKQRAGGHKAIGKS